MPGQMCWRSLSGNANEEKVLHIRFSEYDSWLPYTAFPLLKEPDTVLPGLKVSKGFRTAQVLLGKGFVYVNQAGSNVDGERDRRSDVA